MSFSENIALRHGRIAERYATLQDQFQAGSRQARHGAEVLHANFNEGRDSVVAIRAQVDDLIATRDADGEGIAPLLDERIDTLNRLVVEIHDTNEDRILLGAKLRKSQEFLGRRGYVAGRISEAQYLVELTLLGEES